MANGSGNVSNVLSLGGSGSQPSPLTIPEANSQGYFTIWAGTNPTASAGNFFGFYKNGVAYQVPSGKICKVISILAGSATAGEYLQLASATVAVTANAATITGGVYQFGGAGSFGLYTGNLAETPLVTAATYEFSALTFPCFQAQAAVNYGVALIVKEV